MMFPASLVVLGRDSTSRARVPQRKMPESKKSRVDMWARVILYIPIIPALFNHNFVGGAQGDLGACPFETLHQSQLGVLNDGDTQNTKENLSEGESSNDRSSSNSKSLPKRTKEEGFYDWILIQPNKMVTMSPVTSLHALCSKRPPNT